MRSVKTGGTASITARTKRTVLSITVLLALPVIIGLVITMFYSGRYQSMIRRMDAAAELKPMVETQLAENLFAVAAGRASFEESRAEEIVATVRETLDRLMEETEGSGHLQLTIARRTMDTMNQYVLKVRDGMAQRQPIAEIESVVDEVRNVGRLEADMLDAFITAEIADANETSRRLSTVMLIAAGAEVLLLLLALFFAQWRTRLLTDSIYDALHQLEEAVRRIAEGRFQERVSGVAVEDLDELANQINLMAARLEGLIEQMRQKQEHLAKAELRTLQAQINPHFLYNTLDAIVWQAESGKEEEVIHLTRNLSDFFRISLSAGADWIPVEQELKHAEAYLSIQKTRYRDILDYEIDAPAFPADACMLKLLLQPLVENALYHGIKQKRGGGIIRIRIAPEGNGFRFSVTDTGKGMTPEELASVRQSLGTEPPTARAALEPGHSGFGLRNVDMRIRLYYRQEQGLALESGPGGTEVSFAIPVRTMEDISHEEFAAGP